MAHSVSTDLRNRKKRGQILLYSIISEWLTATVPKKLRYVLRLNNGDIT